MRKEEAILFIDEFLCDSEKDETSAPLQETLRMAKSSLENSMKYPFSEREIDKVMNAIIRSCVDTSNALQDKVLNVLNLHLAENAERNA